jgi:hypothetical protein
VARVKDHPWHARVYSPEQARGQTVDKDRHLGVRAAEMLTGKAAFPGHTISDTIAAILEREPD